MSNFDFTKDNKIASGMYKTNGELYKKIDHDLLNYNDFNSVIAKDKMTDDLVMVLSDDLYDIEPFSSIGMSFFTRCRNIVSVHAEKYKYNFPFNFSFCINLKQIYLPDNLSRFGVLNFSYTENLENIYISQNNKKYKSIDGILYSKNGIELTFLPANHEFNIDENVEEIGAHALHSYSSVHKELIIPNGIKFLDRHSCGNPKTLFLPNSIESVSTYLFDVNAEITIYCSEDVEKLIINSTILEPNTDYRHFKRLTLDDLIENYDLNKTNNLFKIYGEQERQ